MRACTTSAGMIRQASAEEKKTTNSRTEIESAKKNHDSRDILIE